MWEADCHSQCAHWLRNDTVNKRCSTNPGGRTEASAPTEVQQEVPWAGDRKGRPYESVTRGAVKRVVGGVRPYEFFAIQIFAIKKGMPVRASLLSFYAGAIALARVCAYSISRRFDCLASWVTLGRISSRTPLSYLALMLAVSMPATLKLRL